MKLLAFDTATEVCSVAVWLDGAIFEREQRLREHSQHLLAMIDEVLAETGLGLAQLDAVAFGRGPGSFTGLRIGAGVAQGLAFGAGLPVVPVSSLAALAQGEEDAAKVLAAFDARMHQVYFGAFVRGEDGLVLPAGEERVVAPARVPRPAGTDWVGVGSGWDVYHETLLAHLGAQVREWRPGRFPRARHLAALAARALREGRSVPPAQAVPVYLRDEVASKPVAPGSSD